MISIAGGTYLEFCQEPKWAELYGSGLRAAVALSTLADKVQLSTYISDDQEPNLEATTTTFGINKVNFRAEVTPEFHYFHSLSKPHIYPPLSGLRHNKTIEVVDDIILRFGFIDGDAIVSGRRVVYDPQSTYNPNPFNENGSEADHLAILANQREILLLTRRGSFVEAGQSLI